MFNTLKLTFFKFHVILTKMLILCADILDSNNMREVLDWTWDYRANWTIIGIELGIDTSTLDAIGKNNHHKVEDCLVQMLGTWLRGKATRSAMTKALQSSKVTAAATSAQGISFCSRD